MRQESLGIDAGVEDAENNIGPLLRDIGPRYPSSDKIIHLAKIIQLGISAQKKLTQNVTLLEKVELRERISRGREARNELTAGNVLYVVYVAKEYMERGLPLPDLVQEGCLGLLRAAELFDPGLGYTFSTYADFWIRQRIKRALSQKSRMIAVPLKDVDMAIRASHIRDRLHEKIRREPTEKELAEELQLTTQDQIFHLREVLRAGAHHIELDAPSKVEGGSELGENVSEDDIPTDLSAEKMVESKSTQEAIVHELEKKLDPISFLILVHTFGFNGVGVHSPEEIREVLKGEGHTLTTRKIINNMHWAIGWLKGNVLLEALYKVDTKSHNF